MKLYGTQGASPSALLSWAVAREYGLTALPPLARTERGKPYFPQHPHLHFSLSHSGPYLLCALSGRPVGVDIEVVRPRGSALPRYALTAAEYARYEAQGGGWPLFYAFWTRKEAWCKFTGQGLRAQWGRDIPKGLFLKTYAGEGWQASLCALEAPPGEITWVEVAQP